MEFAKWESNEAPERSVVLWSKSTRGSRQGTEEFQFHKLLTKSVIMKDNFSPETGSVDYWSEFLATDPERRVRFPELPDFPRNSGSGTGSTQLRE
jgi:hypothetical protein